MKFKDKSLPEDHITELIKAARLAPSGCNAHPWRFKIVKDKETKMKLVEQPTIKLLLVRPQLY
jgi:nitroreductase